MNDFRKRMLVAVIILAFLNLLLANLTGGDGQTLEGHAVLAKSPEMRRATISTLFFGIQAISFLLGALLAVIPYKGKAYVERWVSISLSIAIVTHGVFFLLSVSRLFTR